MVRIKTWGTNFPRGYNLQFTYELFEVVQIEHRMPIKTYTLKSLNTKEVIEGSFYPEEMQLIVNDGVFKVGKILKRRVRNGVQQELVQWEGFDNRHNTWNNVVDIAAQYEN